MSTEVANIHAQVKAEVADYMRKMKGVQTATNKTMFSMNSLKKAAGALGLTMGAALAGTLVKNAVTSIARFEKSMSDVEAVAGATDEELEDLRKNALKLGGSTKFTAVQVAQLSKELAKLGFVSKEITASSKAILDLAAATDTELAHAAAVAGTTLRSFELRASDMTRVTDVMAASFSRSALDMEKFTNSMKFVAPVAKSAGVDIEFATAMLAKLADVGISGSLAGTSLRRILLEMAKTGKPAGEAFREIATRGITLEGALDEVGRNAVTALNALSGMAGGVEELATELDNVNGKTAEMARVMEDNLIGDWTKLGSAWDGMIQKGGGVNTVLRAIVQNLTEIVHMVSGEAGGAESLKTFGHILANVVTLGAFQLNKELYDLIFTEEEVQKKTNKTNKALTEQQMALLNVAEAGGGILKTKEQIQEETEAEIAANKRLTDSLKAEASWRELINQVLEEQNRLQQLNIDGRAEAAQQFAESLPLLEAYAEAIKTTTDAVYDFSEGEREMAASQEKADDVSDDIIAKNKAIERSEDQRVKKTLDAATQIGMALQLESDERKRVVSEILKANAAQIISDLIASAVRGLPFPANIIAAAGAGTAAGLLLNQIPAFAEGAVIKGPTLGMMGEYPGANTNPEVVGKLSDLKKMGGVGGGVTIVVDGFVGDEITLGKEIERILERRVQLTS